MASFNFDGFARALVKGDIDFDTLSCKVLLVSAAPNRATMTNRSDITSELAATGGYTLGGIAQAFTLDALDTTNHRQPISFTDITNGWTSFTPSSPIVGAVIYKNTGTASTDTLMTYVELTIATQPSNGNFSIDYSAALYLNA